MVKKVLLNLLSSICDAVNLSVVMHNQLDHFLVFLRWLFLNAFRWSALF